MSEIFDVQRWRPAPFLPERETRDGALIFVVAVLCFLACLTAMGVLAADRAAAGWTGQLTGEATVIVRPRGGETPDAAAARAAEVLAGTAGVAEARALEPAKAYDLIRPWLGDVSDLEDLPVPRLVAVTLDGRHPAGAKQLSAALAGQNVDATVDDHSIWIKDIRRAGGLVRWLGVGVFLLIAAAAGAVIAFATRAGLAARRDVVEVLHLAGAEDGFIARLFQVRFAQMAGYAGLIGAIAAVVLGAALRIAGGGEGLTPALPLAWSDLLAVVPCPLLAAMVAAVAAQLTAVGLIRAMP
ncbi:MAG TPA: ABC transporter permease [Phenylobacterium sp.]|jgi:cell division transport system permease protein|uniref:cell division protein FtsX n=1 Tax=Phenylobacterium sp. TaxID=1871053 RepID=UPI002BE9BCBD|nr:ABC transporter permease [Phenylobacterium sp.]HXA39490.1 ABC transporter permease [Phenylobacterium sp.]